MHRLRSVYLLAFAVALSFWSLGGFKLHGYVVSQLNQARLEELNRQLVTRVETALDLVVMTQTDLLISGHASCAPAAIAALREAAYRIGTVADHYVLRPEAECSAFGELSAPIPGRAERDRWTPTQNPSLHIGVIEDGEAAHLGVAWRRSDQLTLLTAMSADALLFDMLPAEIRDHAAISLRLSDGRAIARFPKAGAAASTPSAPAITGWPRCSS